MRKSLLAVVAVAGLASAASAQLSSFTLNDGNFRYIERAITGSTNRTGTGGGSADFGLASGATSVTGDYLFQNWWWYRSAGDNREFALSNQTSGIQISPNTVAVIYDEPIAGASTAPGLRFSLTYTLNQISATQAAVTINWNIENRTQETQAVSFFSYSDSDIGSSSSDDSGSYIPGGGLNYHRNDNSTTDSASFFTVAADLRLNDAWQAGNGFSTTRFGLGDADVDNLANTVSPFVGDWAGALQWNLSIPAGESLGGRVTKGYNYVIPAPGAAALLGLGGLIAGRRRRA